AQTDQNLVINCERPVYTAASATGSSKFKQTGELRQFFQGHLYSRKMAMLIRGEERIIKAWIIPSEFLIGFDTREDEFPLYLEMRGAKNQKGMILWHVDAMPVSYEALNPISKALFAAFARGTRGELDPKERFRLNSEEVKEMETDTGQFIQR